MKATFIPTLRETGTLAAALKTNLKGLMIAAVAMVNLALARRDLLNCRPGGWNSRKILGVDAIHLCKFVEIVQIDVSGHDIREVHAALFQAVEKR